LLSLLLIPSLSRGDIMLPNGAIGTVLGSNDAGDQVGWFVPANGLPEFLGFELDHDGGFTLIGPSFVSQFDVRNNARAVDINSSREVIGLWSPFLSGEPFIFQSFIYSDGLYTKIELLLPPSISHCLDHETVVTSIADSGDVFGSYRIGDVASPCFGAPILAGTFLWRDGVFYNTGLPDFPTLPEPHSWLLLVIGLIGAAVFRRSRDERVVDD
jgi:hypothetical protein